MQKLLIICGPTATGKTSLALSLAKKFSGDLISADSRQVYKDMDIATGKDIPKNFKLNNSKNPFYSNNHIKIYGHDLVKPNQEFSVAHFTKFAQKAIKSIHEQNRLPIIVGGTGLYLNSLIKPPASLIIPPNQSLRQKLEKLNLTSLQKKLSHLNPNRFQAMNHSDKNNPRRLIRAIEISNLKLSPPKYKSPDILWIGLTAPLKFLDTNIKKRVQDRINQGMSKEVKDLVNIYPNWSYPSFSATGYKPWRKYLEKKISQQQATDLWTQSERQYARRQLTWFKKNTHIKWFDIAKTKYQKNIVLAIKSWYANNQ